MKRRVVPLSNFLSGLVYGNYGKHSPFLSAPCLLQFINKFLIHSLGTLSSTLAIFKHFQRRLGTQTAPQHKCEQKSRKKGGKKFEEIRNEQMRKPNSGT